MLSAAKHPRKLSQPAPLWAFDENLRLRLSPMLCWDSSLPVVAQNDAVKVIADFQGRALAGAPS
jgi:hypothetical protein